MAVICLPCSSFVFMSRGTTKRGASNAWAGNEDVECVRLANIIAQRVMILCKVLTLRLVQYMIEQPMTSCFFNMQCFDKCCALKPDLGRHGLRLKRKFVWLGHWGHIIPKPTVLWGSARALKHLVCKRPTPNPSASNSVVRKGSLKQRRRVANAPRKVKQMQTARLSVLFDVTHVT